MGFKSGQRKQQKLKGVFERLLVRKYGLVKLGERQSIREPIVISSQSAKRAKRLSLRDVLAPLASC